MCSSGLLILLVLSSLSSTSILVAKFPFSQHRVAYHDRDLVQSEFTLGGMVVLEIIE